MRAEDPPILIKPGSEVGSGVCRERIDYLCNRSGYSLMLGAGNCHFTHPRVVDVAFDLYATTDVVADAHSLPFRSDTFETFFAMNVLEHLREPPVAIREALRVLKPGGEILIHTAFLQPLHEAPRHFYNATEYGLREWFAAFDDFHCFVSPNFNPLYSLSWLCHEIIDIMDRHQGSTAARAVGHLRIDELAGFWRSPETLNGATRELFFKLPEATQRRVAAGFEVQARKPLD